MSKIKIYSDFSKRVINWQRTYGRNNLPWQQNNDPYRIWLSEIMLQQTQVVTVIPFFLRFIKRFPNVATLANASLDEVMIYWAGLGYYSRARSLHRFAQCIISDYQSCFPSDPAILASLPGVGRSTAAAIVCFAFNVPKPILDGNVKRVFTRVFGIKGIPTEKKVTDQLWQLAEKLVPTSGLAAAHYAQGLMDLGATICKRSKPICDKCPLSDICFAHLNQCQNEYPEQRRGKTLPLKNSHVLILYTSSQVLLEKRPLSGIWGGLWSLPEIDFSANGGNENNKSHTLSNFNLNNWLSKNTDGYIELTPINHAFTHFKLKITPITLQIKKSNLYVMDSENKQWVNWIDLKRFGMPAPIKKCLDQFCQAIKQ